MVETRYRVVAQRRFFFASTSAWQMAILFLGLLSNVCSADDNPVAFVPGDAFFAVNLGDLKAAKEEQGLISLKYSFPPGNDFVGYGGRQSYGFDTMVLSNLGETQDYEYQFGEFIEDVRSETRARLQIDHRTDLEPGLEFPVLVMNRSFDLQKYLLYLRYNETWKSAGPEFEKQERELNRKVQSLGFGIYQPFRTDGLSVAEDWRNCVAVDGLKCVYPAAITVDTFAKPNNAAAVRGITNPIVVDINDIMIVGVPGYRSDSGGGAEDLFGTVYVYKQARIERFRWVFERGGGRDNRKLIKEAYIDYSDPEEISRSWKPTTELGAGSPGN